MWKLLFPRWFVFVGLLGVIITASAVVVFWLMIGFLPVGPGRVLPRGLLIPVLAGGVGALMVLVILDEWFVFRILPLIKHVSRSGWKIGLLKYEREHCDHAWVLDPTNSGLRSCPKCISHQMSFSGPYGGGFEWRDHNNDELRFL